MKELHTMIISALGLFLAFFLFFSIINLVKKSFRPPIKMETIDPSLSRKKQQRKIDDIKRRQEDMMRQQKQRLRDMRR